MERHITVCIPIYDDWAAAMVLLTRLDRVFATRGLRADVLLVDDGSNETPPDRLVFAPAALETIEILHLRRNLGHQRAIAIGITYIQDRKTTDAVVVMDGDGEDPPEAIPSLLAQLDRSDGRRIVFAQRARRITGVLFKFFYLLYRGVHRVLTGRGIEVGNFSIIPAIQLRRLVVVSELWNHYAAAVYKARLPCDLVPVDRGVRISGKSKMDFISLTVHGFSAMSVFADTVGVRVFFGMFWVAALIVAGIACTACTLLLTGTPFSGWPALVTILLIAGLFQACLMALVFVFVILQTRSASPFLPLGDYRIFILDITRVSFHG